VSDRRPKQNGPDPVHGVIDAVLKGLWWLIRLPFGKSGGDAALQKTRAEFTSHFVQIDAAATNRQWREAIMAADILLDKALQYKAVPGQTLGERLKSVGSRLSPATLNRAWSAHKVRNLLAHELQYIPTDSEARQAISDFKATIRELGLL
jgi:hypothetical protein